MVQANVKKILARFIHYPVETLGPGRRVGVWLQGCSIHCEGCISPENQPFDETCSMSVDEAAEQISSYNCDRVTISGGEPFDQAEELLLLLRHIGQIPDILGPDRPKIRDGRSEDNRLYVDNGRQDAAPTKAGSIVANISNFRTVWPVVSCSYRMCQFSDSLGRMDS